MWSYVSRAGDEARSMEAVVGGERPCGGEGSELGRWCGGGDGLEASAKGRKAETVSSFSWKDPVVVPNLIEENVQPWVY
jgi:hypothetical protein